MTSKHFLNNTLKSFYGCVFLLLIGCFLNFPGPAEAG